jgi:prepilin-type N-terminal cleavage/methylation domain-containing protein
MPARRSCLEEEFVSKRMSHGFSLIELAVVMLIFGIVLATGIPSFIKYRRDQELVTTAQNIAGQIRLSRATAMVTGRVQRFHLYYNFSGYDYHTHDNNGPVDKGWKLPKGVTYSWGSSLVGFDLTPDGRASTSTDIMLVRNDGVRDTISVQMSGQVLYH